MYVIQWFSNVITQPNLLLIALSQNRLKKKKITGACIYSLTYLYSQWLRTYIKMNHCSWSLKLYQEKETETGKKCHHFGLVSFCWNDIFLLDLSWLLLDQWLVVTPNCEAKGKFCDYFLHLPKIQCLQMWINLMKHSQLLSFKPCLDHH